VIVEPMTLTYVSEKWNFTLYTTTDEAAWIQGPPAPDAGEASLRHDQSLFARKIDAVVQLSEMELTFLADLQSASFTLGRGEELRHGGQFQQVAYILQTGWASSVEILPDGGRQIITFVAPGDCVGLSSALRRAAEHSLSALTDTVVTRINAPKLEQMFSEFPYLGTAALWAASRDKAMLDQHKFNIRRRTAIERMARLFLELFDRLKLVGLTSQDEFDCPLDRDALADALSLSTIHVSRVLRQLGEQKFLTFREHRVAIHDPMSLEALAGYRSARPRRLMMGDRIALWGM
jgi:CRP/FNR family transcriptional regulator